MSHFSFKEGRPIAKIIGGEHDDRIIYLCEDKPNDDKCCNKCSIGCSLTSKKCCPACSGGCITDDYCGGGELDEVFTKQIQKIKKGQFPYINLENDSVIVPIPRLKREDELKRENIFISGPEESGKSHWASRYINEFRKIYKKAPFFIFSGVEEDDQLDKLSPIRVKLNEKLYDNPINIEEFPNNSIVLFDDIDTVEPKIKKALISLRDNLLEKGRHRGIFVLSITHNPNQGRDSKASLLEASSIVLFPRGGDIYHMRRTLKEYCGYDPKTVEMILKLKSRWVQCHKRYPKFILHEKGAFFPQ